MLSILKARLPAALEPLVFHIWYLFRPIIKLIFYGNNRYCPICNSKCRRFLSHGPASRRIKDVVCPVCISHNRQRLAWIYLNKITNLMDGSPKNFLHIAPEIELARKFKQIAGVKYFSADLESPHAMIKMDITDISCHDSTFDVIYCSHVLEHVSKDCQAMREMFRVLKPNGWVMVQVPIDKEVTNEDPTVTDPVEREHMFWQSDHVRLYGLDIEKRLAVAGFDVEPLFGRQLVKSKDWDRMSIDLNEPIFHCLKPDRLGRKLNSIHD
jgi:SAM-dependent methyltransferase